MRSYHASCEMYATPTLFMPRPEPTWEDTELVCTYVAEDGDMMGQTVPVGGKWFGFSYAGGREYLGEFDSKSSAKAAVEAEVRRAQV